MTFFNPVHWFDLNTVENKVNGKTAGYLLKKYLNVKLFTTSLNK
jgi:hypothetical protein